MSTASRLASLLRGRGRIPGGVIGIAADPVVLRFARRDHDRPGGSWQVAGVPMPADGSTPEGPGAAPTGRSLPRGPVGAGTAVCALSAPDTEIFPLSTPVDAGASAEAQIAAQAQDRLSYPLEEAVIDYVSLPRAIRRPGDASASTLVFAVPRRRVDALLDALEPAGVEVVRVVTPACALASRLASGGATGRRLVLATGEATSSVSVTENGHVLIERILPVGAVQVTERIASLLDLPPTQARALTSGHWWDSEGPAPGDDASPSERSIADVVGDIVAPLLEQLVREASGCIGFCASFLRNNPVESACLVGTLEHTPGLAVALSRALTVEVEIGSPAGLTVPGPYAVAAACASWEARR